MTDNKQTTALQTCINELNKRIEMYDDNPVFNEVQLNAKEQHIYGLQEAINVLTIALPKEYAAQFQTTPSIDYEKDIEKIRDLAQSLYHKDESGDTNRASNKIFNLATNILKGCMRNHIGEVK